jgi:hypothetical protein
MAAQSNKSFMLGFESLTGIAKSDILGNIPLHSIPLISSREIMVHLIPSWMNGISGVVSLMKYLILQPLDIRHTNPSFVPQYTLIIFRKSRQLLFLDVTLNLIDLLIFQLTFSNLLE